MHEAPRRGRTHVGEAAPAVQGHSRLETEHGLGSQQGTLSCVHGMVCSAGHCSCLICFSPRKLLQVHLRRQQL